MRFQWIGILSILFSFSFPFLYAESGVDSNPNSLRVEGTKYCSTCHTPIDTELNYRDALWIHDEVENGFQPYSSSSHLNQHGFPSGETKLCLGCHDGTVAVEDKNIYSNLSNIYKAAKVGFPSHNDHPVSIIYNSSLAMSNGSLYDPSLELTGLGGTIEEDLLEEGMIVCTSCHSIHTMISGEDTSTNHFSTSGSRVSMQLKISNEGSKLCLTCHRK